MKTVWMPAVVLAAAVALVPYAGTAFAENTEEESSAVLAETTDAAVPQDSNKTMDTTVPQDRNRVQLPNPMVPYTSYHEMMDVLGFRPLVLPRGEGYELTNAFVIDSTVSDMRYSSRYGIPEQRSTVTIRTALRSDIDAEDAATAATTLSGIYSVDWRPLTLGANTLLLAQVNDTRFAACWTQGDYIFTCEGENFNRWDFTHRIVYDLMDITDHYYTAD